jgi:hypothetical protein
MAYSNIQFNFHTKAYEDLSNTVKGTGAIYKAIDVASGMIASDGLNAIGLITQNAKSGNNVSFAVNGIAKFTASEAITINTQLTVTTSGYLKSALEGDYVVGKCVSTVGSGSVGTGIFDFANATKKNTTGSVSVTAIGDLSAQIGKVIAPDGDIADDANTGFGLLLANTNSGGSAKLDTVGVMTGKAGGVLTKGASITVTSGWITLGNCGNLLCGIANEASASGNSGSTVSITANFATPHYATNCFDVQYG